MSDNNGISTIIDYAIDNNADGIRDIVNAQMSDRIQDIIAARKVEVAQRFFNAVPAVETEEDKDSEDQNG